jgi:hypothetical protein
MIQPEEIRRIVEEANHQLLHKGGEPEQTMDL